MPTKAIEKLYEHFGKNLIIVTDEKTPPNWSYKDLKPIIKGEKLYAPKNHYARKNLGYMEAIKNKADFILSSDDDNCPNERWCLRDVKADAVVAENTGWFNVYNRFSEGIWPRGFSLRHLHDEIPNVPRETFSVLSSIQQGLSDGEPDVDAIWRLAIQKKPHTFFYKESVYLKRNTWCPFNSQSTWFFPKAYPLMYLPVYASFRMCDIWGSFVAQRCLWEIGEGVTFHSPSEVFQDRNEHDLLKDFADEVPGYLKNDLIVEILGGLSLQSGEKNICKNLYTCYQSLVSYNILPYEELLSLNQWIEGYENAS